MSEEIVLKNFDDELKKGFNKKVLVERILEFQPVYYDKARNWWLWNWTETKWERVDEVDILNSVENQASINTINSKEKNEMLEHHSADKYSPIGLSLKGKLTGKKKIKQVINEDNEFYPMSNN